MDDSCLLAILTSLTGEVSRLSVCVGYWVVCLWWSIVHALRNLCMLMCPSLIDCVTFQNLFFVLFLLRLETVHVLDHVLSVSCARIVRT